MAYTVSVLRKEPAEMSDEELSSVIDANAYYPDSGSTTYRLVPPDLWQELLSRQKKRLPPTEEPSL